MLEPVLDAIRNTNRGMFGESQLAAIEADLWRLSLDVIFDRHEFTAEMQAASWLAYSRLQVAGPMQGYDDLGLLPELPVMRFLVTTGFRRFQESKVRALGISRLFAEVHVDAIDEPGTGGKQALFAEIMARRELQPSEVWVVGDNPDSEIAAGNNLGLTTIQILRPGVDRSTQADINIRGLADLRKLLLGNPCG